MGSAGQGLAIAADGSTELRKKFPAALFGGRTRLGLVCRGQVERGGEWRGDSCRRQQGGFRLSLLLSLESGRGLVRCDQVRCGAARLGQATVADGSTGGFGFLCCFL